MAANQGFMGEMKGAKLFGSLKDALAAASRDDTREVQMREANMIRADAAKAAETPPPLPAAAGREVQGGEPARAPRPVEGQSPSAAEAAREARTPQRTTERHVEADAPPTTRVVRGGAKPSEPETGARTALVRGRVQVKRESFEQDPVVGWLVVVGGPGMGSFRPIFEGNNTVGRSPGNRIPVDFGDDAISADEQAYIRYDSAERTFLFVPNLAKTNVVSVNDKRPTGAVTLAQMDFITMGRTQLVFVPFCGPEFDWSQIADNRD